MKIIIASKFCQVILMRLVDFFTEGDRVQNTEEEQESSEGTNTSLQGVCAIVKFQFLLKHGFNFLKDTTLLCNYLLRYALVWQGSNSHLR